MKFLQSIYVINTEYQTHCIDDLTNTNAVYFLLLPHQLFPAVIKKMTTILIYLNYHNITDNHSTNRRL